MTYGKPPKFLYFGCSREYFTTLQVKGITARGDLPVRLATSAVDPRFIGCKLVEVNAEEMYNAGFQFWQDGGDWCCRYVPRRFLTIF